MPCLSRSIVCHVRGRKIICPVEVLFSLYKYSGLCKLVRDSDQPRG
jgi:hypothetical protein